LRHFASGGLCLAALLPPAVCALRHFCLRRFVPYGTFASGGLCLTAFLPPAVCALRHFCLRRQAFRRLITSGYDPARYCRLTAAFLCLTASLPPAVVSPYGDQRSAALSRRSLDEDGWITSGYDPVRYCCLTATFLCLRRFLCLAALSPYGDQRSAAGSRPGTTRCDTVALRQLFYASGGFCALRHFASGGLCLTAFYASGGLCLTAFLPPAVCALRHSVSARLFFQFFIFIYLLAEHVTHQCDRTVIAENPRTTVDQLHPTLQRTRLHRSFSKQPQRRFATAHTP